MIWQVGQKVVCIVEDWRGRSLRLGRRAHPDTVFPELDVIYRIRSILSRDERVGFRLVEIINRPCLMASGETTEHCFNAHGFRPLTERKTDISIFQRILDDANAKGGKVAKPGLPTKILLPGIGWLDAKELRDALKDD